MMEDGVMNMNDTGACSGSEHVSGWSGALASRYQASLPPSLHLVFLLIAPV